MQAPISRAHRPDVQPRRLLRNCTSLLHAVLAILLAGCAPKAPIPAPPSTLPATSWSVTRWLGDAERVTVTPLSNGVVEIDVAGKTEWSGKGAIVAAPLNDWNFSTSASVRVRAESPDGEIWFALAVRTDDYYESPSRAIQPGGTREFVFDLNAGNFKSARTQWQHSDRLNPAHRLKSVEFVIYPATAATRRVFFQPVELSGVSAPTPPPPRSLQRLSIEKTDAKQTSVPLYGKFEIAAFVSTACSNPFDPAELTVDAKFVSPSGRELTCPGFFFGYGASAGDPDEWRIRFSPDEPGAWTWSICATAPDRSVVTSSHTMTCDVASGHGPLRISKKNPMFFEYADGSFYYPIGHNVCWNSLDEYTNQFALMGANGENWSRVWLAPWNCDIEWSPRAGPAFKGLGVYNLANAEKLDGIVEAAERNGIHFQLVLHDHCRMSAKTNPEWQNNPYNKELGGPCATPQDFLTDANARRMTKNRLRYAVARWGYSPALLAWELFNEADLADDFKFSTDTPWHREMAEYLKAIDPHRHLVTTSYISSPNADVFRLPAIDYTQSHIYMQDLIGYFAQVDRWFTTFGKPHFVGEFGRNTADGEDARDTEGRVLHTGIWAQFMLPDAGNAMSWWWYDLIHPNRLYRHFGALARFAEGLDRRAAEWTSQAGRFHSGNLLALVSPEQILFWIYDPNILPWTENATTTREIAGDLVIRDVADGAWTFEQWDTAQGVAVRSESLAAAGGTLTVPIRFTAPDAAFKIRRAGAPAAPAPAPQLQLEPWDILKTGGVARAHFDIPPLRLPIRIDGSDSDWAADSAAISVPPKDGRSPADNSFTFRTAHDASNLFVFVNVTDDHVVRSHTGSELWKDDCVEFWVDSRDDASSFNNTPNNPGCFQFAVAPMLDTTKLAETITYRNPDWNNRVFPGLEAASALVPNGFVIEVRIPFNALRGSKPVTNPSRIGFNVSTCDADPDGDKTSWKHSLWQGTDDWDARQWGEGEMK